MSDAERERHHDDVFELLPWYHNGSLAELEQARVEAHLANCEVCREELAHCAALEEATINEREAHWQAGDRDVDRVLRRIAAVEAVPKPARVAPKREQRWWSVAPRPARWALVAQAAAIAALAFALFMPRAQPPVGYETLTAPASAATELPRVQIVFAAGVTEQELRALVHSVDGSIVSGPTQRGVYELALPGPAQLEPALASLRADARIRLAEPLVQRVAP